MNLASLGGFIGYIISWVKWDSLKIGKYQIFEVLISLIKARAVRGHLLVREEGG